MADTEAQAAFDGFVEMWTTGTTGGRRAPVLHRPPPGQPLDAIARARRLDDSGREYLFRLSENGAGQPRRRRAQKVPAHLQRLLDGLTDVPALVLGRRMDVLAWNPLAAALITHFGAIPESHRNYVRVVFTDPRMRSLHPDWRQSARLCAAQLHMEGGPRPS